jgi:hypothetical protein
MKPFSEVAKTSGNLRWVLVDQRNGAAKAP